MKQSLAFHALNGEHKILNHKDGLTKRQYFAALAMQAIIQKIPLTKFVHDGNPTEIQKEVARGAATYADALIAELEKSNETKD